MIYDLRFTILIVSILCLFSEESLTAQTVGQQRMDSLMTVMTEAEDDSLKLAVSDELVQAIMSLPLAQYEATTPVRYLGYKKCGKSGEEMFSWRVQVVDGDAFYHVFKFSDGKKPAVLRYIPSRQSAVPGYLFYDWTDFKTGGKVCHVLLGWSETAKTNRKTVQVADFRTDGSVVLTRKLIQVGSKRLPSLVFEYGKEVQMMLRQEGKRIVFDHLAPSDDRYADYPMFYGPDGEVKVLELKKGVWVLRD